MRQYGAYLLWVIEDKRRQQSSGNQKLLTYGLNLHHYL